MAKLWQDLDKLMVFVVVAEKGKINQAADTLHLTQPSITRSIQKLEESFGTELFHRSREGVTLTKAGELLFEKAVRFLRSMEDVQARAQNIDQDLAGHLTVGTYESLAEYLWPDFLQSLLRSHPAMQLSVKTSSAQTHFGDLVSGKIDILVDAEPPTQGSVISWPIYSDKFGFFGISDLALTQYHQLNSQSLNIIYVKQARDENGLAIENHLEKQGYKFAREFCFDSFTTVKRMAIKGLGIAVLPFRLVEDDGKKNQLLPVSFKGFKNDGFGKHTIFASIKSENEKDFRIRKIISLLKTHLK